MKANPVAIVSFYTRTHMNQTRQPQASTSGIDQNAIKDSLKLETRLVAISEIVISKKNKKAVPTNGKYQVIYSLQLPPSTT